MLYSSLEARLSAPLCSVQFLIPSYLMTLLTNYNSGSHLFYGWAPKTFHFLFLQNSFFYSLTTLIYSLAIACYLLSFFSHSLTDSLLKPFSCVISIILKMDILHNSLLRPHLMGSTPFYGCDSKAELLNHGGCSSRFKTIPGGVWILSVCA